MRLLVLFYKNGEFVLRRFSSFFGAFFLMLMPTALIVHFWIVDHKQVLRVLYPLQAVISSFSVTCSPGSPEWMFVVSNYSIWNLRSLSNQVAYIDSSGIFYHCESGSEAGMLSRPVTVNSMFAYGSLTKPITSAAIMLLDRDSDFSVSSDLFNYFGKGFSLEYDNVAISSLMDHTSGIKGSVFSEGKRPWCPYFMDEGEIDEVKAPKKVGFIYSNVGYCVLGEVISNEVGLPYRESIESIFNIGSKGITFLDSPKQAGVVEADYRYNDFYGVLNLPDFDYYAISSTAGMIGSAKAYSMLIAEILGESLDGFLGGPEAGCDIRQIRNCYGKAFYIYKAKTGYYFNVKEGYMPGFAGVVVISERQEVFVWLGASDTPDAAKGVVMKKFLDELASLQVGQGKL